MLPGALAAWTSRPGRDLLSPLESAAAPDGKSLAVKYLAPLTARLELRPTGLD